MLAEDTPAPEPLVVTLACDWGTESPLWANDYSIEPEDVKVSAPLSHRLRVWQRVFVLNTAQQGDFHWRAGFDPLPFEREGDELRADLSSELGKEFLIKTIFPTGRTAESRSPFEPTNSRAAATLKTLIFDDLQTHVES